MILSSRLNNDVNGAQRAFTTFLSTVIGNVINLSITLVTMFLIEWRLTLLSLIILPFFVIPSRRVGARMADITREGLAPQRGHLDDMAADLAGQGSPA